MGSESAPRRAATPALQLTSLRVQHVGRRQWSGARVSPAALAQLSQLGWLQDLWLRGSAELAHSGEARALLAGLGHVCAFD